MQARWEAMLTKAEEEAPKIQQHASKSPSVSELADRAAQQAKQQTRPRSN
jgi:hypothetical protein